MKTIVSNTKKGITGVRSTLNEWNAGVCGSPNNCYYNGSSIVWGILLEDDLQIAEFKTKKEMLTVFEWILSDDVDCYHREIETAYAIHQNGKEL